ncbi:MAG: hypothetical protein AAGG01_16080 [Planctomycetota bacterium]
MIELLDALKSDGAMELEFARDGTFLDMEAEIALASVPEAVRSSVEAAFPGAELSTAELELQSGEWTFEVGFVAGVGGDGGKVQAVVTPGGAILETERELPDRLWPEEVLRAAEAALPGTTLVSVDVISASGVEDRYHVKSERDGARFKVTVTASGEVLGRVREVPAEIEIPLPLIEGEEQRR